MRTPLTRAKKLLQPLLVVMTALVASTPLQAVEPQPGAIYEAGTRISVASLGIEFPIPGNWRGALSPSGEAFLMEPADASATLFVIADKMSAEQAFATLQGPVPLTDSVQLTLDGSISRQQQNFSARYQVQYNPQLSAEVRARAADNGTAIAFFLITSASLLSSYRSTLDTVFGALSLSETSSASPNSDQSKTATTEGTDKTWLSYLKGKHIVRFFTGSGYTEEQHIWLCSNGNYVRRFDGGGFGGGASGAFQGNYDGTWRATGEGEMGQLILNNSSGQSVYDLRWDYATSRLYVDGKRWLHADNEVCR